MSEPSERSFPGQSTNLDLLRAVAVLLVYFSHLFRSVLDLPGSGIFQHDIVGGAGVMFFFVHTFLVLLLSLERARESGWRLVCSFYCRRLFRIYPLSILAVVTMVAFQIPYMPEFQYVPVSAKALFADLVLVQNILLTPDVLGPLWSLPWEVQMYLVMPPIFWLLRKDASSRSAWILWAAVVGLRVVGLTFHLRVLPLLAYAPCFLAGGIAWSTRRERAPRWPAIYWPVAILLAALTHMVVRAWAPHQRIYAAAYASCLVLGVALPQFHDLQASWLTRFSHMVAKYSYGIYLSHIPLMWVFRVPLAEASMVTRWGFLVVSSVLVPVALFHLVEDPMIGLGRKLVRRWLG